MRTFTALAALAALLLAAASLRDTVAETHPMSTPLIAKSTPLLVVERIEPAVAFWRRLGLEIAIEVPEGEGAERRRGFVALAGPGIEVMYQTATSVAADLAASASDREAFAAGAGQGYLYVEVPDLEAVAARLEGERLVMPERTTFYGARERAWADGAGNVIVFAQMPPRE